MGKNCVPILKIAITTKSNQEISWLYVVIRFFIDDNSVKSSCWAVRFWPALYAFLRLSKNIRRANRDDVEHDRIDWKETHYCQLLLLSIRLSANFKVEIHHVPHTQSFEVRPTRYYLFFFYILLLSMFVLAFLICCISRLTHLMRILSCPARVCGWRAQCVRPYSFLDSVQVSTADYQRHVKPTVRRS